MQKLNISDKKIFSFCLNYLMHKGMISFGSKVDESTSSFKVSPHLLVDFIAE